MVISGEVFQTKWLRISPLMSDAKPQIQGTQRTEVG